MSEPANDRVGELVDGRYRLLALVGRGGMADVYRARDELLGRVVAVKLMRAEAGVEVEDALRRHEMEAKIGAGVSHPGLVTVFDVQAHGDTPYLVMEFVAGKTLSRVLIDGPMDPTTVADIGAQLGDALGAIHDNGVIHRDIKPSNVMLVERADGSYQVKLTDFGVSRYLEGTRLTSPDLLVGTARYLSPEQAVLDEVGPRADVYAMGLVLLEALTGEEPFPGSRVETLSARLHRPPRMPESLGAGWLLALGAMTRRDPEERPDARGAAAALRAVRDGGDVAAALVAAGVTITDPEGDATVVGGTPVDDDEPTEAAATAVGPAVAAAGGAAAGAALGAGAAAAATAGDGETVAQDAVGEAGDPTGSTSGAPAVTPEEPATDGAGTAVGDAAPASDEPSPWARRAPWIVVAVVVVAAVAAVWLVLASADDPSGPTTPTETTPTPTETETTPTETATTPTETTPTETTPTETTPTETTPTETTPTPTPTTAPTTTQPTTTAPPTTQPTTVPPTTAPTTAPTDGGEALPTPGTPSTPADPTDG